MTYEGKKNGYYEIKAKIDSLPFFGEKTLL